MHDLVIRGGLIVDGNGGSPFAGDVAVDGRRIVAVGDDVGAGRREIDARGQLVTPGWVDIHTHYDGQATWDPYVSPSGWNGVTTAVMGNCGVGFAPAKQDRHQWLIELMEGVEDIPGTALAAGIDWTWESFPEYLDALERMPRGVDVGAQVPHGAVRAYVMGDRGAHNEKASAEDIRQMAAITREALMAGALGFSTSRTILHRSKSGELVPGTVAGDEEVLGIGAALGEAGHGVFEVASDFAPERAEVAPERSEIQWMRELSRRTGRPVTFACLQNDLSPDQWQRLLAYAQEDAASGGHITPQVAARPAGLLMGLQSSLHPFITHPSYRKLAELPLPERLARLREPAIRAAILAEGPLSNSPVASMLLAAFHKLFPLGDPPDYEPPPERSVAALAQRQARDPAEVAYEMLLEDEGRALLYFPLLGYSNGNFDDLRSMMLHPQAVFGLSDGGAHCGLICDASVPTYLLTHWVRDRSRGERLPLEFVVRAQTRNTAALYGLHDRGVLAPGMKADLNVIDLDALRIGPPEMVHDLPAEGRRLVQEIEGYRATVLSGEVTFEAGEATGALPGTLIRGPQSAARAMR
ncbi:MAG: amidohydrolase family protein [Myxococcales bacterium]|nr:amidohydrolase family protein [Myxococcales bacterium]